MKLYDKKRGFQNILNEIAEASPRASILSAAALIDALVLGTIKDRLVELNEVDKDLLTGNTGPLSTFSGKTLMAYAMGIFGKKTRHDIDVIRKIRNTYAHSVNIPDFEDNLEKLRGLHCLRDDLPNETARSLLTHAVRRLAYHLALKMKSSKPLHRRATEEIRKTIRHLD